MHAFIVFNMVLQTLNFLVAAGKPYPSNLPGSIFCGAIAGWALYLTGWLS